MARMSWLSHDGVEQVLYPATGDIFLEGDTLEGFVGAWRDTPTQVLGEPGVRVDPRNRVVEPMIGVMHLRVKSTQAWRQLRRMFSESKPGWLVLDGWRLKCRLSEGLQSPGAIPKRGAVVRVALVADEGVWVRPVTGSGTVTVTNTGDVPVWPTIRWQGAGGHVVLPSDASFALPATSSPRVIHLRRSAGGKVTTAIGEVDKTLSRRVEVVSEMVPAGAAGKYTVPAGATLTYEIGVLDVFAEVDSWN